MIEAQMIAAFSSRPSGRQIAGFAWSKVLEALRRMPLLVLVTLAAFWLLAAATRYAAQKLGLAPASFLDGMRTNRTAWFYGLQALAQVILALPLTLAVYRFALLGETGPRLFSRSGIAFITWGLTTGTAWLVLLYLTGLLGTPAFQPLGFLPWLGVVGLPPCVLLVFPSVAAETPAPDATTRLETAMAQWGGNVFLFLSAALLVALPVALIWYGPQWLIVRLDGQAAWDSIAGSWLATLTSAITPLAAALAAALASGLYAWARLVPPAGE